MLVKEGWADAVIGHFDDPRTNGGRPRFWSIKVIPIRLSPLALNSAKAVWPGCDSMVKALIRSATSRSTYLARCHRLPFYRKSILFELGRFDTGLSLTAAGVHLALAIEFLGGRCMVEPKSRVSSSAEMLNSASVIQEARDFEHLFWRWVPRSGLMSSPIGHLGQGRDRRFFTIAAK